MKKERKKISGIHYKTGEVKTKMTGETEGIKQVEFIYVQV